VSSSSPRPDRLSDVWLKALAHPVRVRVLESMTQGHTTPKEVAEDIGEPLTSVSYHVKILHELECIELVETRQKRGAMQYIYRPVARGVEFSDGEWADLPSAARAGMARDVLEQMMKRTLASLNNGTFDKRTDHHVTTIDLVLDEDGWREVNAAMLALLDRAIELQVGAADVPAEDKIRSSLTLLHFERSPSEDD
jgi:DNA-binding transcriptional ArsR family regulator